jgi:hypothetical protein
MSVVSYGGQLCSKEGGVVYQSPKITISSMGQVLEAESVNYVDGGSQELLDESKQLLEDIDTLADNTKEAIVLKNEVKADYTTTLALYQNILAQYNALLQEYNEALAEFGTPFTRSIVAKIGYTGTAFAGTNLLNSSIGQYGDTTNGFANPLIVGTGTLQPGSYTVYVNVTAQGVDETPTGDRLDQNMLVFSVTDTNYICLGGANLSSSNFCEYNVTTTAAAQGVLVSLSGVTTFTLTQETAVRYYVMIMRDENYLMNTPNFISPDIYNRTAYSDGDPMSISLNKQSIVVVKMN